jgi:signal transduction histidine kinase
MFEWNGILPERVDSQIEITRVRVVQEALLNVAKHSGAWVCKVRIRVTENQIQVNVTDPGIGLISEDNVYGLGLQAMAARVKDVRGLFKAQRRVNGIGTEIAFAVPHSGGEIAELVKGWGPENASHFRNDRNDI